MNKLYIFYCTLPSSALIALLSTSVQNRVEFLFERRNQYNRFLFSIRFDRFLIADSMFCMISTSKRKNQDDISLKCYLQ